MKSVRTPRTRRALLAARLAVAAVLAVGAAGCLDSTGSDNKEVTIGGIFSLTGNWSSLGVTSKAALELAVEDVNAFAAGQGVHFKAEVRDSKLDPASALTHLKALTAEGVQVVIGPQSSAELAAMKPWIDTNPVLVISQSSTAGSLAIANDNILRFTPSDSLEGIAIAGLLWADSVRAVVPVWRADAGNQGLHTGTARAFTAHGGTVGTGVEYATTTTDFAATVAGIRAQVTAALAGRTNRQVAVQLSSFDEGAALLAAAAGDSVLNKVRWYGADGITGSSALTSNAGGAAFAEASGFPSPVFGLDESAGDRWKPIAARIKARAGQDPDAFALAVYDAVWVAAQAYLAAPPPVATSDLKAHFIAESETYFGATGWTLLNAAGDRKYANFDFFGVRTSGGTRAWTRVAQYDTRSGTLTR
jgi:branched-chain amino acid transport system substrate-binding protein